MFAVDHIILLSAVLAILGVLASKLSPRFGVPVLVLFLGVGMLAGEDGIGRILFDNVDVAHSIGTFALILILFDGGLQTSKRSIKRAWKPAALLATLGVVGTATVTGIAASAAWRYCRVDRCCCGIFCTEKCRHYYTSKN